MVALLKVADLEVALQVGALGCVNVGPLRSEPWTKGQ